MSANTPPMPWPLSDLETEEFRALGLTPGHWIALAPVPLFRGELDTPHPSDLQTLAKLQAPLRLEAPHALDPASAVESESFWKRLCSRSVSADTVDRAEALLAWYLARGIRRHRESYLSV